MTDMSTASLVSLDRTPSETDVEDSAHQLLPASQTPTYDDSLSYKSSFVIKLVEKRMRALNKKISRIGTRYAATNIEKLNDSQRRSLLSLPALKEEHKELEDAKKLIGAHGVKAFHDQALPERTQGSSNVQETISDLEKIIQEFRETAKHKEDSLNGTMKSLPSDLTSNETRARPERILQELRVRLTDYQSAAKQKEDSLNEIIKSLCADLAVQSNSSSPNGTLPNLEKVIRELRIQLADFKRNIDSSTQVLPAEPTGSQQKAKSLAKILRAYQKKYKCESLYAEGNVVGAAQLLLDIARRSDDAVKSDVLITNWIFDFANECATALENSEE